MLSDLIYSNCSKSGTLLEIFRVEGAMYERETVAGFRFQNR
jgi:hypothetical protein